MPPIAEVVEPLRKMPLMTSMCVKLFCFLSLEKLMALSVSFFSKYKKIKLLLLKHWYFVFLLLGKGRMLHLNNIYCIDFPPHKKHVSQFSVCKHANKRMAKLTEATETLSVY